MMKRVYGILMLVTLMIFGGCLGKKDERVTNGGGVTQVEKPYVYTNVSFDTSKLVVKTYEEVNFSLIDDRFTTYKKASELKEGELERIEFPYDNNGIIGVIVLDKIGINKDEFIKSEALQSSNYIKKAFGMIELKAERNLVGTGNPMYIHGEINNVSGTKEVNIVFAEKNSKTYVVYEVYGNNKRTTLDNFEAIISTIQFAKRSTSGGDTGTGGGIINPEEDEVKYIQEIENVLKAPEPKIIEEKVQQLYDYIDKTYIDNSITDSDLRKEAVYKFLSTWKYNEKNTVARANVAIRDFYRAIVEGELAKINSIYADPNKETDRRYGDINKLESALNELIIRKYQENFMYGDEKVSFERVLYELYEIYDVDAGGSKPNSKEIAKSLKELIKHYTEVLRIEYFNDNKETPSKTQIKYWEDTYEKIVKYTTYLMVIEDVQVTGNRYLLYTKLESTLKEENRIAAEYLRQQAVHYLILEANMLIGASSNVARQSPSPRTVRTVIGDFVEGASNDDTWVKIQRENYYNQRLQETLNIYDLAKNKGSVQAIEAAREGLREAFKNYVNIAKYTETNIVTLDLNTLVTDEDVVTRSTGDYKILLDMALIRINE